MKTTSEIMDEICISICEIKSIMWCARNILNDDTLSNREYSHLAPVIKIAEEKFDKLQDDFSVLENKIQ